MGTPVRYTSGVSTYPPRNTMANFPVLPTAQQTVKTEDFLPFRSGDYTATNGGTGALSNQYLWNGGLIQMIGGSTSPFKAALGSLSTFIQPVPGNQFWADYRVAVPVGATMANPCNDANVYFGLFGSVDPSTAQNGIYFVKPSGGTAINLVVLNSGVATTFQNIGDFAVPSGLFGDKSSTNGSLAFNTTGTTFSSVAVQSAGSGYNGAPLVITKGTAGSGASVYCQLGSSASALVPTIGGSSLYAPYIAANGSGYTAGTLGADVVPFIDLQLYYNGKGRLVVGINGKTVLSLDTYGTTVASAGQTYNVATQGNSYNFKGSALNVGQAGVNPPDGDPYVAFPKTVLQPTFGIIGTTANNRTIYVCSYDIAVEYN